MSNPFEEDLPKPKMELKKSVIDEKQSDIFKYQKVKFNPPEEIKCMCVCNDLLVIAMKKNKILRIDLIKPDLTDELEVTKSTEECIENIFLDPLGQHLVISMSNGDNYYLARTSKKLRILYKFKGHTISSIAWNVSFSSEISTSFILVGTTKGILLEAEIATNDEKSFFTQGPDVYCKQLFNFSREKMKAIYGIAFGMLPTKSKSNKYFIMIILPGRLYQLIGNMTSTESPYFQNIFSKNDNLIDQYLELAGVNGYGELKLFYSSYGKHPLHFGWLTNKGVYFGEINQNPTEGVEDISLNAKQINFPELEGVLLENPISFVITQFHLLVLFSDRVVVINIINQMLVQVDTFSQTHGRLKKCLFDCVRASIWVASSNAVFRYTTSNESRDILQIYLNQNEFKLAKKICENDANKLNLVLKTEANYLYTLNKYTESAKVYSQINDSFEDTALKFSLLDDKEPLRTFLYNKLLLLPLQDRTQRTLIVVWLCEILLNELGNFKDQGSENKDQYKKLQADFEFFLSTASIKDCLIANKQVIYDLFNSHGDNKNLIWFADYICDYEMVVLHLIEKEDYGSALAILTKQIKNTKLIYKYSSQLILHVAKELVNIWIQHIDLLDPEKFIPSLIQYDQVHRNDQPNQAIVYLEFCVKKRHVTNKSINNYLIAMYVKLKLFDQLFAYLQDQGQDVDLVNYNLEYALRLCSECEEKRCCVHIYTTMGYHQQAVELALKFDIELAQRIANKPTDDLELKRKLWLQIARHVVEEEKDIKKAMEFLKEGSFIRIEDVLPFFPEFVTIDHFKDAICSSLQQYNEKLENLKQEMEEATENALIIRKRIQAVREQCSLVGNEEKCYYCKYLLMIRPFYVFPCKHYFHTDCFIIEIMPYLSSDVRIKLKELQNSIASLSKTETSTYKQISIPKQVGIAKENQNKDSNLAELTEKLDALVAKECIFCGEIMINSINLPFVEDGDMHSILKTWI